MDILVTYDIDTTERAGQRRLARVAKICESYGQRVQKSVFECRLNDVLLGRLIARLEDVVQSSTDSVHIYQLIGPTPDTRTTIGRGTPRELGEPWIL